MSNRKIMYEPRYKCRICGKPFKREDLVIDHEPTAEDYSKLNNALHDCYWDDTPEIDDLHIFDLGVGDLTGFFAYSSLFDADKILSDMIASGELNQGME